MVFVVPSPSRDIHRGSFGVADKEDKRPDVGFMASLCLTVEKYVQHRTQPLRVKNPADSLKHMKSHYSFFES
ncbi:hypothetical protein E2C01_074970 [Portunus trituberculatus]|uniref:Uncharacterized protein n=1 Tax=Portunus trituberculatus TaxID=210409 RepID=A0A5B7I9E7_PORTR|nr:hypothetical protein [Portunus trituberculatus]